MYVCISERKALRRVKRENDVEKGSEGKRERRNRERK